MQLLLVPLLLCLSYFPPIAQIAADGTTAEPVSTKILFPVLPGPATPAPVPGPVDGVPILQPNQIYVVQSDVQFLLLASPKELAKITYETGPIKIRGIFADGSGQVETRKYTTKNIALVDAVVNANGRIELIAVPIGIQSESEILRQLLDIGVGPRPPPEPIPPTPVPPEPIPPTPVPTGFRVIFVYETSANLTREQMNVLLSPEITKYLDAHCAKDPTTSRPEWRRYDPDIIVNPKESPTIAKLWAATKPQLSKTIPVQLVITSGTEGKVFNMPNTVAATLALLQQYGGP